MKAHIARNQNARTPMVLCWNLNNGDRGILTGMSAAFGMKCRVVRPEEAGSTVAALLGDPDAPAGQPMRLDPSACPPAIVLANFSDREVDRLLGYLRDAKAQIPVKAVVTPTSRGWSFGKLLLHLVQEHEAYAAQQH